MPLKTNSEATVQFWGTDFQVAWKSGIICTLESPLQLHMLEFPSLMNPNSKASSRTWIPSVRQALEVENLSPGIVHVRYPTAVLLTASTLLDHATEQRAQCLQTRRPWSGGVQLDSVSSPTVHSRHGTNLEWSCRVLDVGSASASPK